MIKRRNLTLLLLVLVATLTACPEPAKPPPPEAKAVLFPTTKVADADTRAALQSYDSASGAMVFAQSTPTLENLKVGDVIASEPSSAADGGYLRKINSVQRSGSGFTLQTQPATLLEAIKEARLLYEAPLTPDQVQSATPELQGVKLRPMAGPCVGYCFEATVNAEVCLTDACGNAKVKLEGSVKFNMGLKLDSKWSCCVPPIDWFEASVGVSEQANLKITGNIQGSVNKRIKIATYNFNPITISLGIPLVFFPSVALYVGVDGSASVNFEYGVKQTFGYRLGVRWENGKGWNPIKEFTPTFAQDPAPTLRGAAKIFTYAEVEPKLSLYKIADIQANFKAGPELEAGFPRDPLWNLRGKLIGGFKFGVTVPIIDKEFKYDAELFNTSFDIAKAGNEPPAISSLPSGGSRDPGAYSVLLNAPGSLTGAYDVVSASDPQDGANVTISASSSIDGAFSPVAGGVAKNLSVGVHTITVRITDPAGLSVQGQYLLNVRLSPPILTSSVSANTVQQGVGLPATASATYYDAISGTQKPLPCASLTWDVNAPDALSGGQTSSGCTAIAVFGTQGSRTVRVTATTPAGGTASQSFTITVTAPPDVLPPLVDPIQLLCNNAEPPQTEVGTGISKCAFGAIARALVNARDPDGKPLTYAWTLEPRFDSPTQRVALGEDLFAPPSGYTSAVTTPRKSGIITINPDWLFSTVGQPCGGKFTVTVSNGGASTSRSAELACIVNPN